MTTTPNRNYSLPSRHHDVVDDINDLRTTFGAVDEDLTDIETAVSELSDDVSDTQAVVIHTDSALENTEIQNIAANRYLVVNRTGDGFECLDGGGDAGGKTGQCSIKKSDQEFDTAWGNISEVSKNGMIVKENTEASESGETHIFVDETEIDNDKQFPKVELTNCQAKADFKSDSNSSVIIRDNIEEVEEEIQIATNLNYGFIKVGNGLSVDNGTLSAPVYSAATMDDFGLIKTGSGINNNDGVISYDAISPATPSSFGVVKLGENLSINSNGEMEIDDMGSATIYDLGNVKVCSNGIVELEEATLRYRLFVTEDLMIQFSMDFEPRDDFSFVLELVSDGTHLVAFSENLNPQMSTLPINRGTTKIEFTKKLGVPSYDFEISRLDAPNPVLLTAREDVRYKFLMNTPSGSSGNPHLLLKDYYDSIYTAKELYFEFFTLVCVDYVKYWSRSSSVAMRKFVFEGSNDNENWTTLIYKENEICYGKIYTERKGCFRYYKLTIDYSGDDNKPSGVMLFGTEIDNNEYEVTNLTPYMASNSTPYAALTASNITSGSAANITDDNTNTYMRITSSNNSRWIKYELTEPAVANMLELNFTSTNSQANWFKLEGSNDNGNWELLLERQYPLDSIFQGGYRIFFYYMENETAYKYYKLTCLATNDSSDNWDITGFKLFFINRGNGKHNFYRGVPKLSSANQDGYVVTASSQYDGGHAGYLAFDDNTQTRWASAANEGNSWLQVKLPTAMAFNVVKIAPRGDNYLDQAPSAFQILGSNDGENWDVLDSETNVSWTTLGELRLFQFENETEYLYYRLYITANQGSAYNGCSCFILGNVLYEYKRYLDKYEYLVPVMSSNSQNGYVVSSNSYDNSYLPFKAFNRQSAQGNTWISGNIQTGNGVIDAWLQIQLPTAQACNMIQIACGYSDKIYPTTGPKDFEFKGSNDGTNWTTLYSATDQTYNSNNLNTYTFDNNNAYLYYRLQISKIGGTGSGSRAGVSIFNLINSALITEY